MHTKEQKQQMVAELVEHFDTYTEAADFIDVSHSAISRWVSGVSPPSIKSTEKLAMGLAALRRKESRRAQEAYGVDVNMNQFWFDDGELSGISLRKMVEAGLYSTFQMAKRALETQEDVFNNVLKTTLAPSSQGGRPAEDYIFKDVRSAEDFCVRANTKVGNDIRQCFLNQKDEFVRLKEGDGDAWERMGAHQERNGTAKKSAKAYVGGVESIQEQMRIQREHRDREVDMVLTVAAEAKSIAEAAMESAEASRRELREFKAGMSMAVFGDLAERDKRAELNSVVSDVARVMGDHRAAWNKLYSDVGRQLGVRVKVQAKAEKLGNLDWLERYDYLDLAYSVAVGLLQRYQEAA